MTITERILEREALDGYTPISRDEPIKTCGIDSFGRVVAYMNIGELYDIPQSIFEEDEIDGNVTLGDLIDFIELRKAKNPTEDEVAIAID